MPGRRGHDIDGLYKRPGSPYWWASYPDGRGGYARRSTGVKWAEDPRKARAKAARAALIAETQAERPAQAPAKAPPGHTFDELMLLYLDQVTPGKASAERDQHSAKRLCEVFTGRVLAELGKADVRGYIAKRQEAGVGPGTINRELGMLSSALNWARDELEWEVPNPVLRRRLKEPEGRVRWLTRAEAAALLKAARAEPRAPWIADFVLLGLYTGMRRGEMLGLEWRRVDLQADLIYLEAPHQKSRKRGSVPLNATARTALLARARFRAEHCPASPWVFCDWRGKRVARITRSFATACRRAGLEDFHPHDLRHTCAAWLVQAGRPLAEIRDMLRHSTIEMTERYAHLAPANVRATAQVLDHPGLSHSVITLPDQGGVGDQEGGASA